MSAHIQTRTSPECKNPFISNNVREGGEPIPVGKVLYTDSIL